jgi:AbrB family looped-hinge helix DNA binding protein
MYLLVTSMKKQSNIGLGVIDKKGRVTVPREIRLHLGLVAGDRVEFIAAGKLKHARFLKFDPKENPFEKYQGILGSFPGGEKEIIKWVRNMRNEE